ncbi:hypothetical protein FRX31_024983 [Thalictrum thalictroides]|uniref:Uncharacterized protein n=1 Tax=Thalictrum thalictroides TaxID=46969 RepID=A0A7J6VK12_THATH|nr:hypothetical protein FRX31_024983 [Thalictrum thalictroides]
MDTLAQKVGALAPVFKPTNTNALIQLVVKVSIGIIPIVVQGSKREPLSGINDFSPSQRYLSKGKWLANSANGTKQSCKLQFSSSESDVRKRQLNRFTFSRSGTKDPIHVKTKSRS